MNDINALKLQQRDKHPGFNSYLECMTRGLFSGLTTFAFGEINFEPLLERELNYIHLYFRFQWLLLCSEITHKTAPIQRQVLHLNIWSNRS